MRYSSFLFFSLFTIVFQGFSQNYKITYSKNSNGNVTTENPFIVLANTTESIAANENNLLQKSDYPIETTVYSKANNTLKKYCELSETQKISMIDSVLLDKYVFETTSETKKILGYTCKKAKTVVNSNHIDVWFTNDLKIYGSPRIIGSNLGLVLEINQNNTYIVTASKIEKTKEKFPNFSSYSQPVDKLTYNDLIWKSRFTNIPVFEDETINFSDESVSNDSIIRLDKGVIILKKVKFPKIKATDLVFMDVTQTSNGDAYDRTGTVFLLPEENDFNFLNEKAQNNHSDNFNPVVELMRFFTPFGIDKYNYIQLKGKEWFDEAFYRQDISDFSNFLSEKEFYIGASISNYDKGGHKISVNITIHSEPEMNSVEKNVIPLFNTTKQIAPFKQNKREIFADGNRLKVSFTLDKPLQNAKLRYITTGHGGWENGDEFVPKENTIYLNGNLVYNFTPWRQDCGSYRLFNPASGNFDNGLSSSDYSRSNWCPGTVTNPTYINLGNLEAGNYTIEVEIPQGKPEGNSSSHWNVSGVLIGE